jgi:protein-disulfide isomerase
VETGKVKFYFFDMPLESIHKRAFRAAEAAACAGLQDKFWEMHDLLFENSKALADENLQSYAETLGLDMVAFNGCLEDGKQADSVRKDMAQASKSGVRGTPNFWIGVADPKNPNKLLATRNLRGAKSFNDFKATFDELLAAKSK